MVKRGLLLGVALVFSATAFAATPFAGKWEAKFTGGDQGHCAIHIKPSGQLNGTCHGRNEGKTPFHVAGYLHGTIIHFGIAGTGAEFQGSLKGDHGKGVWRNTGDGGNWVMKKD